MCVTHVNVIYASVCDDLVKVNWALEGAVDKGGGLLLHLDL